jgi:very-short-patch-repair endonuclease
MKKLTTTDFVDKANKLHKNKYDYRLVEYVDAHSYVKIICPIHGVFEQTPNSHTRKRIIGCPTCAKEKKQINEQEFLLLANDTHNNKFDYSKMVYKSYLNDKIIIFCDIHGEFTQTPYSHIQCGCPKCSKTLSKEDFVEKCVEKHGDRYDYSETVYIDNKTKVRIKCKDHGYFEQYPSNHYSSGNICPQCNIEKTESNGERKIREFLEKNNITTVSQKRFDGCRYKNPLPFDFYLPEHNICIEFDGQQHFIPSKIFGGDEKLLETQRNDKIKNEYCADNGIKLIRIKYNECIEDKLISIQTTLSSGLEFLK